MKGTVRDERGLTAVVQLFQIRQLVLIIGLTQNGKKHGGALSSGH
jgi:hypothetical protein